MKVPINLDVFTDAKNKVCSRYFALLPDPQALRANAFAQNWSKHECYMCPPARRTAQMVRHLIANKARGTLVVPMWVSKPFWNL
jgi:hypothetical protein